MTSYDSLWPFTTTYDHIYLKLSVNTYALPNNYNNNKLYLVMTSFDYLWPIITSYDQLWPGMTTYMTNDDQLELEMTSFYTSSQVLTS